MIGGTDYLVEPEQVCKRRVQPRGREMINEQGYLRVDTIDGLPEAIRLNEAAKAIGQAQLLQAYRLASALDRAADAHLFEGRHSLAEHLSHRASELRGAP
jgi:hypothetical protein